MMHKGDKLPYAPWTDKNAPAPCSEHGTTTDKCDCSARFKWGWEQNRREFEAAKMTLDDPELEGVVFIQEESDPFVFVDGDDVRCPETGRGTPSLRGDTVPSGPLLRRYIGVWLWCPRLLPGDLTRR